jgi:AcrR family transcriptional regulator
MARPITIKADDLLEAARQVFLEKGTQATTAQVAERAGVSEGTLFKRFGTKADLFRSAMNLEGPLEPAGFARIHELAGTNEVEENLVALAHDLIAFFEKLLPLMTMQWSNPRLAGRIPSHLAVADPPPLQAQRKLAAYLDAEVALGRATVSNTSALARAFLGGLNAYVFFELMIARPHPGNVTAKLNPDEYVRSFVSALWNGMRPANPTEADSAARETVSD